jgi:phosphatidylinositol alpha-1,6-mannosyltransferase
MTYVSEWCRDRIAPALSAEAASRMVRLSPGVDTDRFYPGCGGAEVRKRLGIPADAPVVVCTARMIKRKGQDTLVKAWPAVLAEFPDAVLLLVGDGPNRSRVERLAKRLGVEDSVIFTGSVPWEEMPAYTDAGDVFAMPCRTRLLGLEAEAFGIVFLEAAACGLPVIAGESGGAPAAVATIGASMTCAANSTALVVALVRTLADGNRDAGSAIRLARLAHLDWRAVSGLFRELL